MESRMVLISDIQIGERARQDLGDLSDLAQSIKYFSLLAPPVVTGDLRLIAGHRRIEACKSLGTMAIPVLVAEHVVDAADLLRAERDENTCRKAMVASELIALGRQIEALQRPQSRERQVEAGRAHGRGIASVPANESYSPTTVDSRDAAAEAVGMSSSTYSRVKQVANGADGFQIRRGRRAPVSPERQAESQAALALIDRVSRGEEIRPSFDERPLTVTAIYEQWIYLATPQQPGRALFPTLRVVGEAWGYKPEAVNGCLLEGIGMVFARFGDAIQLPGMVKKLSEYPGGPGGLLGKARGLREFQGGILAHSVAEIVVKSYNTRRRAGALPDWK